MMKIGITGSIASGKTTASKILAYKRGPLFSADKIVKNFYKRNNFKNLLIKKFNIKNKTNFKNLLKTEILKDKHNIVKLEKMARQGNARFFRSPLSRHDRSNLLTSFWIFSSSCSFCFLLFLLRAWVRLQE